MFSSFFKSVDNVKLALEPLYPLGRDFYFNKEPIRARLIVSTAKDRAERGALRYRLAGAVFPALKRAGALCNFFFVSRTAVENYAPKCNDVVELLIEDYDAAHSSYSGHRGHVVYTLEVSFSRLQAASCSAQCELRILNPQPPAAPPRPLTVDIGIQDCLKAELRLESSCFDVCGQIRGSIEFKYVNVRLRCAFIKLLQVELMGAVGEESDAEAASPTAGGKAAKFDKSLLEHQLVFGTPSKGAVVPIQLPLHTAAADASFSNLENLISLRHCLSLCFADESERTYYKMIDVTLFRSRKVDEDVLVSTAAPPQIDLARVFPAAGSAAAVPPSRAHATPELSPGSALTGNLLTVASSAAAAGSA